MPKFIPSGYFSIRDALNRLGRELFQSEWTGEEHKARSGLISEDRWLRIKDLPPPRGSDAPGGGGRRGARAQAAKPAPHPISDPSDPRYQKEYRARGRYTDTQHRLRQLLEAGQLEAAILDPWSGRLHRAAASLWRRHDADRMIEKGRSTDTEQSQYGFSSGQSNSPGQMWTPSRWHGQKFKRRSRR